MKQTLLSLAALIGFAGAAKAQVKLGEEYTYTASVTVNSEGKIDNSTETYINFDDLEYGKTYQLTCSFTPISKELKNCTQLAIQGGFDNWGWHCIANYSGFGDKIDGKVIVKCNYKKEDGTLDKGFKISPNSAWTTTPSAGTYKGTVTVTIIEQNITPRGDVVYNGPTVGAEEDYRTIMELSVGNGKDIEKITSETEIYIEYEGSEAEIAINEQIATDKWSWEKAPRGIFFDGVQKITYADIKVALDKLNLKADNLTKLVFAATTGTKIKKITVYSGSSTPIANIEASDAEVVSTTYYSITGAASAEPAKGMNVVKEQLSDGNIRIRKIMVK